MITRFAGRNVTKYSPLPPRQRYYYMVAKVISFDGSVAWKKHNKILKDT